MDFLDLAKARYSVRSFEKRPIEEDVMGKILEAGRVAPTAKNNQPQQIYILKSQEALAKINALCRCIFGAPVVLLVCYDEKRAWKNPLVPGYDSGEMDSSIVCTHMMMEAWELGVGSCWVGYFNHQAVAEAFGLPAGVKPAALLPMGYPAKDAAPSPKFHPVSRPLEEMVEVL